MARREGLGGEATQWRDEMTSGWKGREEEVTREGERGDRLPAGFRVYMYFLFPELVLPDRALCLPAFSHFLIVNKTSLFLSLSRSATKQKERERDVY